MAAPKKVAPASEMPPVPIKPAKHGNTLFTSELADEVCDRIAQGESLAEICRDPHMPSDTTIRNWQKIDPDFASAIARARDEGHDAIAHKLREITRGRGDSTGDVQRDKLIVETDLKLLAKWNPKKYGDKLDVNATVVGEIRITIGGDI